MVIKVSSQDIIDGNKSLGLCPITIALRKIFSDKITVSRNFIRVKRNKKTKLVLIELPKSARDYLLTYNVNEKPFSFELSTSIVKLIRDAV